MSVFEQSGSMNGKTSFHDWYGFVAASRVGILSPLHIAIHGLTLQAKL